MEKNLPEHNAEAYMTGGACSYEYAKQYNPEVRMLVSEVPYFSNDMVSDTTISNLKRKDALISGYTSCLKDLNYIQTIYNEIEYMFSSDNQFYLAVKERIDMIKSIETNIQQLQNNDSYDTFATKSQVFDSMYTMKFYSNLSLVLCRRACEEEIAINPSLSERQTEILKKARNTIAEREKCNLEELEKQIPYSVIPIQNLIKVQLESGLLYAQHIQNRD